MTTPPTASLPPVRPTPAATLWRDGAALVVRRDAPLPTGRCLRCHEPAAGLAPIPGSAQGHFQVALCASHRRWIRFSPAVGSTLAVFCAGTLLMGAASSNVPLALLGFYGLIASMVAATMARGTLRTSGSSPHFVRISGVSVRYLQTLHGWNDYPEISA